VLIGFLGLVLYLTSHSIAFFWYASYLEMDSKNNRVDIRHMQTGLSVHLPARPPARPLACLARKTSAPARQGNIEYIRVYSSIFKYI
jgi:hypothetical protein